MAERFDGAASHGHRAQYGALPLARDPDGSLKVLLVTSRETGRWVIPKGWPIKGLKPHRVAAREAYEEAGLVGEVGKRALGSYTYEKTLKNRTSVTCVVQVYPFRVRKRLRRWPEKKQRDSRWFSPEDAAAAVQEAALREIVRAVAPSLAAHGPLPA